VEEAEGQIANSSVKTERAREGVRHPPRQWLAPLGFFFPQGQEGTMEFGIRQEQRGDMPLLKVQGELDIYTAPRLKEAVLAALTDGAGSLAIDLSEVEFLDSTGLQVLMSAKKRTAERGGDVYLLGVGGQIRRVFTLLSLERIFKICRESDLPAT
jgi:anti-sigma B factor antagonist